MTTRDYRISAVVKDPEVFGGERYPEFNISAKNSTSAIRKAKDHISKKYGNKQFSFFAHGRTKRDNVYIERDFNGKVKIKKLER